MGIIEVWTILAVILHLCGVGSFAEWPLIANPFTWSCLCLEIWVFIFYFVVLVGIFILGILSRK